MGARNNDSCREFFEILKILPLTAQYIYSLLMVVVNNRNLFLDNAELYTIKTKKSYNETKEFKKALKRFLLDNSFYSMDEFFN